MAGTSVVPPSNHLGRLEFVRRIDHTLLRPTATKWDVNTLCEEALKFDFWSVCVVPSYVKQAAERLKDSNVKVCTVVGFPLGSNQSNAKLTEAMTAVGEGADEIDMVMNQGFFKSGEDDAVYREIEEIAKYCRSERKVLKVIIECCNLTDDEKVRAGKLAERAGAHYVKTSTGFGTGGATIADVSLLRKSLAPTTKIKAAGGIGTLEKALAMIYAGADRIGTSSGAAIMAQWTEMAGRGVLAKPR